MPGEPRLAREQVALAIMRIAMATYAPAGREAAEERALGSCFVEGKVAVERAGELEHLFARHS